MNFDWPYCDRCKHGVEKVERRIDIFTGDLVYIVTCHGEYVTQRVAGLDLHDVTLIGVTSHFDEKPTSAYPSVTFARK